MKKNLLIILSIIAIMAAMVGFSYASNNEKIIKTTKGNGYIIKEYETENGSHAVITRSDD